MLRFFLLSVLVSASILDAQTTDMRPGVSFVTTLNGAVDVTDKNDKQIPLKLHSTLLLDAFKIKTGSRGSVFFSLSNNIAFAVTEDSELEILEFKQVPFDSSKEGNDFEPSISKLKIKLKRGSLALSCDHLSPLSVIEVISNSGLLRIHSTTSIIEADERSITISAFEGTCTYYFEENNERQFIAQPQSVKITTQSAKRNILASNDTIYLLDSTAGELAEAVKAARQRVLFKAVPLSEDPKPILLVKQDYYELDSARPYIFKDRYNNE
jgi:hypothetical protein